ncbi:hypothetical protein [Streptomyces sp. NPDC051001]|uniref:hypothetical protein n=1 Tax=Streptomyces sp. NPDC051001 TaxID=3155795 RepID=UPI003425C80C
MEVVAHNALFRALHAPMYDSETIDRRGRPNIARYLFLDRDLTYRTYYDRALLNVDGDVWRNPGTWRPQIVVVNLGSNDFSDLTPGEPWTPDSLAAAYRTAYGEFLRSRAWTSSDVTGTPRLTTTG